jgi:methionyl-tRNA formyltransferase
MLNWSIDASTLYNTFRAWNEEPGCFAVRSDSEQRVKIIEGWGESDRGGLAPGALEPLADGVAVGTGKGSFVLSRVQPAGKAVMDAKDWYRGLPAEVAFRV